MQHSWKMTGLLMPILFVVVHFASAGDDPQRISKDDDQVFGMGFTRIDFAIDDLVFDKPRPLKK